MGKKIGYIIVGLIILSQVVGQINGENTSRTHETNLKQDILGETPFAAASLENIPAQFGNFSALGLLENLGLTNESVNRTLDLYYNNQLTQDHFATIGATFWWVKAMKVIDPIYLTACSISITAFVMSCYNATSGLFQEKRPYDTYQPGAAWLRQGNHPTISHNMAIIILAELGTLAQSITPTQKMTWEASIRASQNMDGGFGVAFVPNSTILETYYSTYALYCLNDFSSSAISPTSRIKIGQFITYSQRKADVAFGQGGFSEYVYSADYQMFGWDNYLVHYLAVQILRMIQFESFGNMAEMANQFQYFLTRHYTYNTNFQYFYSQYNDYYYKTIKTYSGNTLMWDPILYFGLNGSYNEENVYNTILESWNPAGYFRNTNQSTECDLILQAMVLEKLTAQGQGSRITQEMKSALNQTMKNFRTLNGGISFTSISYYTPNFYLPISQKLSNGDRNSTVIDRLYSQIMAFRSISIPKFQAQQSVSSTTRIMFDSADNFMRYDLKVTYEAIRALDEGGYIDRFMNEIGMLYVDFEQYPVSQLLDSGFFKNCSTMATGNLESTYYALRYQKILIDHDYGATLSSFYTSEQFQSILNAVSTYVNISEAYWSGKADLNWNRFYSTLYLLVIYDLCNGFDSQISITRLIPFLNDALVNMTLSKAELHGLWEIIAYLNRYHPQYISLIKIPILHSTYRTILGGESSLDYQVMDLMNEVKSSQKHIQYQTPNLSQMIYLDKTTRIDAVLFDHISIEYMSNFTINDDKFNQDQWINYGAIKAQFNIETPNLYQANATLTHRGVEYSASLEFFYALECNYSYTITESNQNWMCTITAITPNCHGALIDVKSTINGTISPQFDKKVYVDKWVAIITAPKPYNGTIWLNVTSPLFGNYSLNFTLVGDLPGLNESNNISIPTTNSTTNQSLASDSNLEDLDTTNLTTTTVTPDDLMPISGDDWKILLYGVGTCGLSAFVIKPPKKKK